MRNILDGVTCFQKLDKFLLVFLAIFAFSDIIPFRITSGNCFCQRLFDGSFDFLDLVLFFKSYISSFVRWLRAIKNRKARGVLYAKTTIRSLLGSWRWRVRFWVCLLEDRRFQKTYFLIFLFLILAKILIVWNYRLFKIRRRGVSLCFFAVQFHLLFLL